MTGLPATTQVLLDNFLGAFPYDITQYVRMTEGITWQRGTGDEQSTISPGTMSLTLDNTDGRFTYGIGAPYGINTDQLIKVIVNGVTRFQGRVQSWPVAWPGGGDTFALAQITAVDDLVHAARTTLRAAVVEDILTDSPTALYMLSEEAAATTAGDSSANGQPSLTLRGSGSSVSFATGVGPTDGLTATQFLGGVFLGNDDGGNFIPLGGAYSVECFFVTSATPAADAPMAYVDSGPLGVQVYLAVTSTGKLRGVSAGTAITSAASINDGLLHHAAMTLTAGGALTLYLDGASVATAAGVPLMANAMPRISIAPNIFPVAGAFIGTLAHVATYATTLSAARVAAHSAGRLDYVGELPGDRLRRIAGYAGLFPGSFDNTGGTLMGPSAQEGRAALDVIIETNEATQGVVYYTGPGALTNRTGATIAAATGATATVDANLLGVDTTFVADMTQVVNYVTGKATSSENVYGPVSNATSITFHGRYSADLSWNVSTDAQAVDRTNWRLNKYAGSHPRIPSLTIDLMSLSGAALTAAFALEVGLTLALTGLPSQTPPGMTSLVVFGISETISATEWSVTLNCVLRSVYTAWLLDDTTYSVLDTTTKLYF